MMFKVLLGTLSLDDGIAFRLRKLQADGFASDIEALQVLDGLGRGGYVVEDDECLAPTLYALLCYDVDDVAVVFEYAPQTCD